MKPCFNRYKLIQFKRPKCILRSPRAYMKSRFSRPLFSLLFILLIAGSCAAQSSTPTANATTPQPAVAPAPTTTESSSSGKPTTPVVPPDKTGQSAASSGSDSTAAPADSQGDPLKRPLSEKQKKANAKALKQELGSTYKKWLNEDVRWIITPEELSAFKQLSNDEERDQFIEQFWLRRDPTPDTEENEFKEEHYRRIAYANEHFAAGIPGWKSDRGRMYIMYGPADEIESHPSGGTYDRPMEEGGGTTSTYPFEDWRYR